MRELGEQWIEKDYSGKPHMYKAVGVNDKFDPCIGCCNQGKEEECYNAHSNCGRGVVIIKDLGPVNEDGCLAEERTGIFPVVENRFHNLWAVTVSIDDFVKTVQVTCYGDNKQEAIDAWNRRTM